ncbi:hypothetical protein RFI_38613 [Reticulomyxa filosa]|uniref:Uncharacterized protein n=1 Tax=Reticulomyxa filosa TaxID=46433 RepID=X6LDU5_RETFI|nr:hypothetical protein RFI_38613 [Reticulomyxa filosa]|eukprot:ETN98874.1 hypothetical protein RFI_38613 [Reticulomyxa filosa]
MEIKQQKTLSDDKDRIFDWKIFFSKKNQCQQNLFGYLLNFLQKQRRKINASKTWKNKNTIKTKVKRIGECENNAKSVRKNGEIEKKIIDFFNKKQFFFKKDKCFKKPIYKKKITFLNITSVYSIFSK